MILMFILHDLNIYQKSSYYLIIFFLDTPNSNIIVFMKALLLPHANLLLIYYSYVCYMYMCACMYACIVALVA